MMYHHDFMTTLSLMTRGYSQQRGSGSQQTGSGLQNCGSGRHMGCLQTCSGRQYLGQGRHVLTPQTGSGQQQRGSGRHLKMSGKQQPACCAGDWAQLVCCAESREPTARRGWAAETVEISTNPSSPMTTTRACVDRLNIL